VANGAGAVSNHDRLGWCGDKWRRTNGAEIVAKNAGWSRSDGQRLNPAIKSWTAVLYGFQLCCSQRFAAHKGPANLLLA
jgi:hypothetical protein